jgi:hypothetical protein
MHIYLRVYCMYEYEMPLYIYYIYRHKHTKYDSLIILTALISFQGIGVEVLFLE